MTDLNEESNNIDEIVSFFIGRTIVLYLSNGDKILGTIISMGKSGIFVRNPVQLLFDDDYQIKLKLLFGGIEASDTHAFSYTHIINFTLVHDYVSKTYHEYIKASIEARTSFFNNIANTINNSSITIH